MPGRCTSGDVVMFRMIRRVYNYDPVIVVVTRWTDFTFLLLLFLSRTAALLHFNTHFLKHWFISITTGINIGKENLSERTHNNIYCCFPKLRISLVLENSNLIHPSNNKWPNLSSYSWKQSRFWFIQHVFGMLEETGEPRGNTQGEHKNPCRVIASSCYRVIYHRSVK